MDFISIDYTERAHGYLKAQSVLGAGPSSHETLPLIHEHLQGSLQYQLGFLSALIERDASLFLMSNRSEAPKPVQASSPFSSILNSTPNSTTNSTTKTNLTVESPLSLFPHGFRAFLNHAPTNDSTLEACRCLKPFITRAIEMKYPETRLLPPSAIHTTHSSLRSQFWSALARSTLFTMDDLTFPLEALSDLTISHPDLQIKKDLFDHALFTVALERAILQQETRFTTNASRAVPMKRSL